MGSGAKCTIDFHDDTLAERAADDVEVDAALEALHDGEVDLWEVWRHLLGLHDTSRRLLHSRVGLLQTHHTATALKT